MASVTISFLKKLKQQLTTGNRRSIHLNVLPGTSLNRLDVMDLAVLDDYLPNDFLETLFKRTKFNFTIAYNRKDKRMDELDEVTTKKIRVLTKRLNAITYENYDNYLEHGIKPFAFGYPILIKRDAKDPKKVIKAPLLIWHLDIVRSTKTAYQWSVRRDEDYPIYFNQVLASHFESTEGISLQNISEKFLLDNLVDAQDVVDVCNQLLQQLQTNESYAVAALTDAPGRDTLKHIDVTKPSIRWSGVFGIFKTQKQSIIKDIDWLIDNYHDFDFDENKDLPLPHERARFFEKDITEKNAVPNAFASVATDPSQQNIVQNIGQYTKQIVQGPPGTGKSQSLTALITWALAEGKKCLVVCEKRTALEVLQQNLNELGLQDLNVIIEDIATDRKKVVHSVRNRIDQQKQLPKFNKKMYDNLWIRAVANADALNKQHRFLTQNLLENDNWTNVVGRFLHSEAVQSHKALNDYLNYTAFDFTTKEYQNLKISVLQGQILYQKVGHLQNNPLEWLHHSLYESDGFGQVFYRLENEITALANDCNVLVKLLQEVQKTYAELLKEHYEGYAKQLKELVDLVCQGIKDNLSRYGHGFNQRTGLRRFWLSLTANVSAKHLTVQSKQQEVLQQYKKLIEAYTEKPYFDYTFAQITDQYPISFEQLVPHVEQFKALVLAWEINLYALVNAHLGRLSMQEVHPNVAIKTVLEKGQQQYQQFLKKINESNLIQAKINPNIAGLTAQIKQLTDLHTKLQAIQYHLPKFAVFYNWKHFFVRLNSKQQVLLMALVYRNTDKWYDAFNSWYLNAWLLRKESANTPKTNENLQELAQLLLDLQEQQPLKIQHLWQEVQKKSVRNFEQTSKLTVKRLYNKRGSKGLRRHSLRKIIAENFDLFSDFFPVVLVNPVVCSAILPLKANLFDVVIFDEASQLRLEDTFVALLRGKYKVVSGDRHQMPPSDYFGVRNSVLDDEQGEEEMHLLNNDNDLLEKESLLDYADDMGYKQAFLDFHYRSKHAHLIDFSNAAFYGQRLVPMPKQTHYKAIRFIPVNGLYDKSVNLDEVERVVQLLSELPLSNNKQLPSVGIATFNLYQRNAILERLQTIKMANNEQAKRIMALEAEGLFVKNLENIQGDERDVIILSTTFGKRTDGRFLQLFGPINQTKGYKLLNVIVTRAKQQVYVCTSIPASFYTQYAQQLATYGLTGRTCLYAYLCYAQAIENNDETLRKGILKVLSNYCPEQLYNVQNIEEKGTFVAYLYEKLKEYCSDDGLKVNHKVGGFVLDLVCLTDEPVVVEVDAAALPMVNATAYSHDLYRERQLKAAGFRFYRLYTANWWLNEAKSLANLVDFVQNKTASN